MCWRPVFLRTRLACRSDQLLVSETAHFGLFGRPKAKTRLAQTSTCEVKKRRLVDSDTEKLLGRDVSTSLQQLLPL